MLVYWLVVLLFFAFSLGGILYPEWVYPSVELYAGLAANDWTNLLVGTPFLVGLAWIDRQGSLLARLFLPGALLFVIYNTLAYARAMVTTWAFWPMLGLFILAVAALALAWRRLDWSAVGLKMDGRAAEPWAGSALVVLGSLFFLRALGELFRGLTGVEGAVTIADLVVTPLWVAAGVLLWRRLAPGYVLGAAALFQAALLFLGLLVLFVVEPLVLGKAFRTEDFAVILGVSLVCFIPLIFFSRGVR